MIWRRLKYPSDIHSSRCISTVYKLSWGNRKKCHGSAIFTYSFICYASPSKIRLSLHCSRLDILFTQATWYLANGKNFRLANWRQRELEGDVTVCSEGEASSAVVPTIHGTSFRGLSIMLTHVYIHIFILRMWTYLTNLHASNMVVHS